MQPGSAADQCRPVAKGLVGRSSIAAMEKVLLAKTGMGRAAVCCRETGTGKELVTQFHETNSRADAPFVAVDCAGMTETARERIVWL